MTLNAVLTPLSEGGFRALNPETELTCCAATPAEALAGLSTAVSNFLREHPDHPILFSMLTSLEVDLDYTPASCPI